MSFKSYKIIQRKVKIMHGAKVVTLFLPEIQKLNCLIYFERVWN